MELVPTKYERHIFICVNDRDEGDCCAKKGAEDIVKALRDYVNKNGLFNKYNITRSKCLGHCAHGPTIAIYPEGFIFRKVSIDDTKKIIEKFLPV